MAVKLFQFRRGTAAVWAAANPVPSAGEPGIETDTGVFKIGDGATAWAALTKFLRKSDTDALYLALAAAQSAAVAASQSTTSTTYVDLTTVGPTITLTIGPSGRALIALGGDLQNTTANAVAVMGFAVSGATTIVPGSNSWVVTCQPAVAGGDQVLANVFMVTGLTPGVNTFTCKYKAGSGTASFTTRTIAGIPL